jgi:GR25 family glycosyltransferase involved in LPS biosynthesis
MYKYLLILVFVLLVLVGLNIQFQDRLASAHVINMDTSVDRLNEFMTYASQAGVKVIRWPATDGRKLTRDDITAMKLSHTAYHYSKKTNMPGILGCFVSHRSLLQHLHASPAGPNDVHLIFEDDARIPRDFKTEWAILQRQLPHDWEFVYLGVTNPNTRPLHGRIHKPVSSVGNKGMFAYAVKHSALPKITKHLEWMNDPADNMIANKNQEWKMYVLLPQLVPHNDHGKSTIAGNRRRD